MSLRSFLNSRRKVVCALVWLVLVPAILLGTAAHGYLQESWKHLFRFLALVYLDIAHNNGETLRNVGLPAAAFIGVILGAWRIGVQNKQSATALRQSEAAERGHRDGRFEKSAELMSSSQLTSRIGAIAVLVRLSRDYPEDYHVQCTKLLSDFIRFQYKNEKIDMDAAIAGSEYLPDVEAAAKVVGFRHLGKPVDIAKLEASKGYKIDLTGANLSHVALKSSDFSNARIANAQVAFANLSLSNLSGAWFTNSALTGAMLSEANLFKSVLVNANMAGVNLEGANLTNSIMIGSSLEGALLSGADLSQSSLVDADLSSAILDRCNLNGALLNGANLSGASIRNAFALTQGQLDSAYISGKASAPNLENSTCAESGRGLVWNGEIRSYDVS